MVDHIATHTLNNLIEICRDGEQGYREAARHLNMKKYQDVFETYAHQRHTYIEDLQGFVVALDSDPQQEGTLTGVVHRGWMDLRVAMEGDDEKAILQEVERGEDAAVHEYEAALKSPLSDAIRGVIQRQYEEIVAAHDHIKRLRDEHQAG